MWHHYDDQHAMGGWGVLALIFWLVVTFDLILLGVWLWQKIEKKK